MERPAELTEEEWKVLYPDAEKLFNLHTNIFEKSVRNRVVKKTLQELYPDLPKEFEVQDLPMAGQRRTDNDEFVTWYFNTCHC